MGPRAAVIFDFDGVLVDSIGLYYRLYRGVAANWGRPFPPENEEAFRDWYNPKWEENYRTLGFAGYLREEAMQWVAERIDYSKIQLFPNVKDMLTRFHQYYPLGIASTTLDTLIIEVLEREGIDHLFDAVVGGGDEGSEKTTMVGEAWRQLGAPAAKTIMVGDTSMDIMAAHHWGLTSVGVTYGWMSVPRLEQVHPKVTVHDPMKLEETIDRLINEED